MAISEWPFPLGTDSPRTSAFALSVVRSFLPLTPVRAVLPEIAPCLAISYFISYQPSLWIRQFRPVLSLYIKAKIHLAPQSSFSSLRLWCLPKIDWFPAQSRRYFIFGVTILSSLVSMFQPVSYLFPLPEKTSEQRHGTTELTNRGVRVWAYEKGPETNRQKHISCLSCSWQRESVKSFNDIIIYHFKNRRNF